MRSRFNSHKPYTASRTSSGAACFILYQRSHSARSCSRKSADRSITFAPPSSSARASFMATPCGVAKNTTSQPFSAFASGSVNDRSTRPRRLGNIAATGLPASLREVIARSSTCGCCASNLSSSTPVYPVPPTIPALIIYATPKTRKPPWGGFRSDEARSAFRELLAPPCLVQSDLLSLHFARIARHQSGRAELRLKPGIILDERPRDAVPHRAGLAALAAAIDIHPDIEAGEALGELEGLPYHHAPGLAAEELVDRLAVDDDLALAGLEEYPGHGALAPASAVVVVADHQISRAFGCCAE